MAEYIEREALLQFIEADVDELGDADACFRPVAYGTALGLKGAMSFANALPAADVVEVRHGEWVYYECVSSYDGAKSGFACSVCSGFVEEDIFDMDEFNKDFCGACGAKMDGKGEGK